MSAVSRMAQYGSMRARLLLQNGALPATHPANLALRIHNARAGLPAFSRALTVPLGRRTYATETSTSTGGNSSFPPPGFNAQQAKKPLPKNDKDAETENIEKEADDATAEIEAIKKEVMHGMQSNKATGEAKTRAMADQSLTELAARKATATSTAELGEIAEAKKELNKLTIWQKVKKEANHYWDGTKLLGTEVRISSKLALKMAAGYELSRREHRQLQRTVQDLGRLVPFSVFVIVPFAELLLPVALRLFPNLLPSTYEAQSSKDKKSTSLRTTRKEVSNFLRDTLKESGLPVSKANAQREEFTEFFRKVRATGESPTQADVIKVCKIFKDDLTLDNLSRPQLVAMCRYMNQNTFGADVMLRYHIRHRMRQIKRDDKAIAYEGVESLSVPELQMACASRGLRTHGMSPGRLRDDLQMWLDLRLKYGVPSTLLVLSNAYMYTQHGKDSEIGSQIDALQAVLSSIPEELFHEIELEVHNAEGAATNKQRLEVLKEQEELIEEENEQNGESSKSGRQPLPKDDENIDEDQRKAASDAAKDAEASEQEQQQAAEAREAEAETEQASKKDAADTAKDVNADKKDKP